MVTFQVELGVLERSFILRLLTFGGPLDLERPRVDLGQQGTLLDELTFAESNFVQLPVHARPHRDGIEGDRCTEPRQVDADVPGHRRRSQYGSRADTWARGGLASGRLPLAFTGKHGIAGHVRP